MAKNYHVKELQLGSQKRSDHDRLVLATDDIATARAKLSENAGFYIQYTRNGIAAENKRLEEERKAMKKENKTPVLLNKNISFRLPHSNTILKGKVVHVKDFGDKGAHLNVAVKQRNGANSIIYSVADTSVLRVLR